MKTAIVYIHVINPNSDHDVSLDLQSGTYEDAAWRFIDTYKKFPAGADHELVVVFTNGLPPTPDLYKGLDCTFLCYKGTSWCTGVHQWASQFLDCEFALFSSARTHFWKEGWLKRIVDARLTYGEGIYGTMSSNEGRPHLRTNFYGIHPNVLRDSTLCATRGDTWTFESGDDNISHRMVKEGKPAVLVTWDGHYHFPDWRKPDNIFRRGDQSNCLVLDRHTEIFKGASDEERERLIKLSDGGF